MYEFQHRLSMHVLLQDRSTQQSVSDIKTFLVRIGSRAILVYLQKATLGNRCTDDSGFYAVTLNRLRPGKSLDHVHLICSPKACSNQAGNRNCTKHERA